MRSPERDLAPDLLPSGCQAQVRPGRRPLSMSRSPGFLAEPDGETREEFVEEYPEAEDRQTISSATKKRTRASTRSLARPLARQAQPLRLASPGQASNVRGMRDRARPPCRGVSTCPCTCARARTAPDPMPVDTPWV